MLNLSTAKDKIDSHRSNTSDREHSRTAENFSRKVINNFKAVSGRESTTHDKRELLSQSMVVTPLLCAAKRERNFSTAEGTSRNIKRIKHQRFNSNIDNISYGGSSSKFLFSISR